MSAQRIVVVGAGFAGLKCVQRLERELKGELARGEVEIVVVNPHDYMLYLPLLPQVAAGVITAQSVTVPLPRAIHRSQRLPGQVIGLDLERKVAVVKKISEDVVDLPYDRLVISAGSVTRQFDIPGLEEHGLGMKNLGEAAYLRDHVLSQLELANASTDPEERGRALPLRRGRRRLRGHRDRRVPRAAHRRRAEALPAPRPDAGASGPSSTSRRGSCPSSGSASARRPSTCCAGAASGCGSRPASRRSPPTASRSPTATRCRRRRSCGRQGSPRARW